MTSDLTFQLLEQGQLLEQSDPPPVERLEGSGNDALLLVCEHAGQTVPAKLNDLGLAYEELQRHIAWDIGAATVTRRLSARLGAPAILQRYSRLVIDCNRPPGVPSSIPEVSDLTEIPGNKNLAEPERLARVSEIFRPFEDAIASQIERMPPRLLADIHSFTPVLQGCRRPWEIGLLFNRDDRGAKALMAQLKRRRPGLAAAFNQPYRVTDRGDFTIPTHGEQRGLMHILIEIRNDLISDEAGAAAWSELLAACFTALLEDPS
ncbi:MAG: N-formylglutamate amidohydrolase [Rhodospirillales bacterium]|nr:N-formylglutamate amidohydrolase [Rhodospirillales bacterium]